MVHGIVAPWSVSTQELGAGSPSRQCHPIEPVLLQASSMERFMLPADSMGILLYGSLKCLIKLVEKIIIFCLVEDMTQGPMGGWLDSR